MDTITITATTTTADVPTAAPKKSLPLRLPSFTPRFLKDLESREAKSKESLPKDPITALDNLLAAAPAEDLLFPNANNGHSNYDDDDEAWSYSNTNTSSNSNATSPKSTGDREQRDPKEIITNANYQLQQLTKRFPNIEVGLVTSSPSTSSSKQGCSTIGSLLPKRPIIKQSRPPQPPQLIKFPSGTTITKSPPQQPSKHNTSKSIAFQCPHPQCDRLFRTQDNLSVHMFQCHSQNDQMEFQDEEDYGGYSSEDLSGAYGYGDSHFYGQDHGQGRGQGRGHITGTGQVQCKHCPNKYSNQSEYRQHLLEHTRERPFSCKYCGKRFFQSSHLTVHIRIHTGEKPYKCEYCEMTFNSPSNCRVHERTHNKGNEIYTCTECGIGFLHKSRLDRHLKSKKHVTEPYAQYYQQDYQDNQDQQEQGP